MRGNLSPISFAESSVLRNLAAPGDVGTLARIDFAQRAFYGLAIAPEIGWIRDARDQLVRLYQIRVPGSAAARELLLAMASECRSLIRELLLCPSQIEECKIEFVPGTSRALEIALVRSGLPDKIILSPFEHAAVFEVAKWFASVAGSRVCKIHFDAKHRFLPWKEQEDKLLSAVVKAGTPCEHAVFVLSQVSYATGVVIPVTDVTRRLKAIAPFNVTVIVDGAHSAGNCNLEGVRECSSYVFSAHKWLLAPEPCGVILSSGSAGWQQVPYDCWAETVPTTTANVHMIAGLLSSLRFIEHLGLQQIVAYSLKLRRQFEHRTRSYFKIVSEHNELKSTSLVAICPTVGRKWKFNAKELNGYLEANSVHATVLSVDDQMPWVRLIFSICNDIKGVNLLCDVLEAAVV